MTSNVLHDDLSGIRDLLGELVDGGLDDFGARDGVAGLELLALNLIGPFAHPEMPADAVSLLPEALVDRGDELAAGILTALAEFAPESLSVLAAEARGRLAASGVTSRFAERVGVLEARECYRVGLVEGEAEMLGALVQRPGDRKAQAVVLFVEHERCGGVIVHGLLCGPEDPEAVRELLCKPHSEVEPAEAISGGELTKVLSAALQRMVDHLVELPVDVIPPLLVLERALTGRSGHWPRPALGQQEAEERLRSDAQALVEAFAAFLDEQGDTALLEHGPFVAETMCDWKVGYAGGRLERWTVAELEEFLLDWYPRKGDSQDETVRAVPSSVAAFLSFLAEMGRLSGHDLETLTATVARLRVGFEREARDPRNWGPAKSMVMQMRAEDVDPSEPGALEAWVEGFNARLFAERDEVLGRSSDRGAMASIIRTGSRSPDRRKARRRTAKAARKRNRR